MKIVIMCQQYYYMEKEISFDLVRKTFFKWSQIIAVIRFFQSKQGVHPSKDQDASFPPVCKFPQVSDRAFAENELNKLILGI